MTLQTSQHAEPSGPEKHDPVYGEQARGATETSEQEEMSASEWRRRRMVSRPERHRSRSNRQHMRLGT